MKNISYIIHIGICVLDNDGLVDIYPVVGSWLITLQILCYTTESVAWYNADFELWA